MKEIPEHLRITADTIRRNVQIAKNDPARTELAIQTLQLENSVAHVRRVLRSIDNVLQTATHAAAAGTEIDYVVLAELLQLGAIFDEYVAEPEALNLIEASALKANVDLIRMIDNSSI